MPKVTRPSPAGPNATHHSHPYYPHQVLYNHESSRDTRLHGAGNAIPRAGPSMGFHEPPHATFPSGGQYYHTGPPAAYAPATWLSHEYPTAQSVWAAQSTHVQAEGYPPSGMRATTATWNPYGSYNPYQAASQGSAAQPGNTGRHPERSFYGESRMQAVNAANATGGERVIVPGANTHPGRTVLGHPPAGAELTPTVNREPGRKRARSPDDTAKDAHRPHAATGPAIAQTTMHPQGKGRKRAKFDKASDSRDGRSFQGVSSSRPTAASTCNSRTGSGKRTRLPSDDATDVTKARRSGAQFEHVRANQVKGSTIPAREQPPPAFEAQTMHPQTRVVADPAKDEPLPIEMYSGTMDLWSCDIDDLRRVYLPKGALTMRYQDLHDAIRKRQAEGDRTGSIFLPTPRVSSSSPSKSPVGGFVCRLQPDPAPGKARTAGTYEIIVQCLEAERRLIFRPDEITFFPCPNSVVLKAGVSATATDRAEGVLKMTRVWEGKNGQELFEGFFSFGEMRKKVEMAKSGDLESFPEVGENETNWYRMAFWAIRSKDGQSAK